jgi:hypothetical protein
MYPKENSRLKALATSLKRQFPRIFAPLVDDHGTLYFYGPYLFVIQISIRQGPQALEILHVLV